MKVIVQADDDSPGLLRLYDVNDQTAYIGNLVQSSSGWIGCHRLGKPRRFDAAVEALKHAMTAPIRREDFGAPDLVPNDYHADCDEGGADCDEHACYRNGNRIAQT